MTKTVLITGSSTGIGKAAADYFLQRGWNVAATMRNPDSATGFKASKKLRLIALDVTSPESIKAALKETIQEFGEIDVIVNNAGYGAVGIFEKATREEIQKQFDTNVFGVMNVTREILPHFKARKSGTIINITSVGGRTTFPLYSVYHGTKWAVEGYSEALNYELAHLGIKVKCVEPGAIKTDFYTRSMNLFKNEEVHGYDEYEKVAFNNTQSAGDKGSTPDVVAKKIFKAATDNSKRIRYVVGGGGPLLLTVRKLLPLSWYMAIVRSVVEKGFKKK